MTKDISFDKATELVDHIDKNYLRAKSDIECTLKPGSAGTVFRGQADSDWLLTPSVHRSDDALSDFLPMQCDEFSKRDQRWLAFHLHHEIRAVRIFLEHADKVGIQTPISYTNVEKHEEIIRNLFNASYGREEVNQNASFPPEELLEGICLAQHHGVPTRLIDWSESPLIAAYFAAEKLSSSSTRKTKTDTMAVIALKIRKSAKSIKLIKSPQHNNEFMRAQRGIFTLITDANNYVLQNNEWPSIEKYQDQADITRLLLPSCEANELLKILNERNISRHTMMPSLDNCAKHFQYIKNIHTQQ